jgi:hypothetical protein
LVIAGMVFIMGMCALVHGIKHLATSCQEKPNVSAQSRNESNGSQQARDTARQDRC